MRLYEEHVVPERCAMAFGIASSRSGYERHLATRAAHDFVPAVCPAWPAYARVVRQLDAAIARLRSLGVVVHRDVTLEDFGRCFDGASVVILFSHWARDSVEFDDGLAPYTDVVSAVPHDFSGVVDLCVCHPAALVLQLRRDRRECLIKASQSKTRISYWLQFYVVLFQYLRNTASTYSDAVEIVATGFLERGLSQEPVR